MQLSLNSYSEKTKQPLLGFRFTNRDSEILYYLLQMKFATTEDLHVSHFTKLRNGSSSESLSYCKERIALLKKLGLITSQKHPRKWSSVLLPTWKSYYVIRDLYFQDNIPTPRKTFDLNTFEHDHLVLKFRNHYEQVFKVKKWKSDLQIKSEPNIANQIKAKHIPDAIFTNDRNERVAFELEISQKSKESYREKLKDYIRLLRSVDPNKPFDKVEYVCLKENIFNFLKSETRIFGDLISVKNISDLNFSI